MCIKFTTNEDLTTTISGLHKIMVTWSFKTFLNVYISNKYIVIKYHDFPPHNLLEQGPGAKPLYHLQSPEKKNKFQQQQN